jgi:hypothetical protein
MTRKKGSAMVRIDNLRKCSDVNGVKRQKRNHSAPQPPYIASSSLIHWQSHKDLTTFSCKDVYFIQVRINVDVERTS